MISNKAINIKSNFKRLHHLYIAKAMNLKYNASNSHAKWLQSWEGYPQRNQMIFDFFSLSIRNRIYLGHILLRKIQTIQIRIIYMIVVIFHMLMFLCINFSFKAKNAKNIEIIFKKSLNMFFCMITSCIYVGL